MTRAREIIVTLTLLCYLAASSVASAHGLSILSQKESNSNTTQITETSESDNLDCHSSKELSSEESSATTCKIFCSVMGQAMAENSILATIDSGPLAIAQSFNVIVVSRQLTVETHPPK